MFEQAGSFWLTYVFGNPILAGIIIFLFFVLWGVRQGISLEGMVAVGLPLLFVVTTNYYLSGWILYVVLIVGAISLAIAYMVMKR